MLAQRRQHHLPLLRNLENVYGLHGRSSKESGLLVRFEN